MPDRITGLGLFAAPALIAWVVVAAAGPDAPLFWQGPSAALVAGGALLTALIAFPWRRFRSASAVLRRAVVDRSPDPRELIATLVVLAHRARRDGLLSLEGPVEELKDDFLKRALRMAVDGADARTIEQVCRTELEATDARHALGSGWLETVGRAAPAFGMVGTVIGLVVMLNRLEDPARIGPGMAVALLTTLYGLLVANVFCLPLARRLTIRSGEELLNKTIALHGVLAIHAGDNPRMVEQKLRAFLPAGAWSEKKTMPAHVPERTAPGLLRRSLLRAARLNPLNVWPARRARRAHRREHPAVRSADQTAVKSESQTLAGAT
ncbi:MAG: MotA/TolQ/ExbB proton channel family protein [Phycisphaerae bacterium]|jgi:chemotaxis protein MotA